VKIAKAWAIFADINSEEYTTEEKGQAVMQVCGAATHNSITKAMMLRVIWWLLNLAFDVPEGARGPEA
jgi:hypothetical protein